MAVLVDIEGRENILHVSRDSEDEDALEIPSEVYGTLAKPELHCLRDWVDFPFVPSWTYPGGNRFWYACLDKEGELMQLPINKKASERIGQEVRGNVVFLTSHEAGQRKRPDEIAADKARKEQEAKERAEAYKALEPVRRRARRIVLMKKAFKIAGAVVFIVWAQATVIYTAVQVLSVLGYLKIL